MCAALAVPVPSIIDNVSMLAPDRVRLRIGPLPLRVPIEQ
jgi:hypothetical protein